jgi:hypothetical protein
MPPVQETNPSYRLFTAQGINSDGQTIATSTTISVNNSIETAIFNSLVSNNITSFGGANFQTVVPSTDVPLSDLEEHLSISNYEPDFGSTWAIRANHVPGSVPSSSDAIKNEFSTDIGIFKNEFVGLQANQTYTAPTGSAIKVLHNKTALDNENTTYYDSHLRFAFSDSIPEVEVSVKVGDDTTTEKYRELTRDNNTIRFDHEDLNYNAFKAANSYVSRTDTTSTDSGLQISDRRDFNYASSLLINAPITRNAADNKLIVSDSSYSQFVGHTLSVIDVSNNDVYFGALKITQVDANIAVESSANSLRMPVLTAFSDLPSAFTISEFNNLFVSEASSTESTLMSDKLASIGDGYKMTIEGVTGGDYTTTFYGFTLDYSALAVNPLYMSKMTDLTNVEHFVTITDGSFGFSGSEVNKSFFTISDSTETLSSAAYNGACSLTISHNSPDARASIGTGGSANISNLITTYATTEPSYLADIGVLSNEHKSTSNVKFDVSCLLGTNDSTVVTGPATTSYIGNQSNHSFYMPSTNKALNGGDITISSVSSTADTAAKLFQVTQSYNVSDESNVYSLNGSTPVESSATASVSLTNINLSTVPSKDMRVVVMPKPVSWLSAWSGANAPTWRYTDNTHTSLRVSPDAVSFMGDYAYDYLGVIHSITMSYSIDSIAADFTQMNTECVISLDGTDEAIDYSSSGVSTMSKLAEVVVSDEFVVIDTINAGANTRNSVNNLFSFAGTNSQKNLSFEIRVQKIVKSYSLSLVVPYGQYDNLSLQTQTIYETGMRISLHNLSGADITTNALLKRLTPKSSEPISFVINGTSFSDDSFDQDDRMFSTTNGLRSKKMLSYTQNDVSGASSLIHTCNMSVNDLYAASYYLETKNANGTWSTYSTISQTNLDVCNGVESISDNVTISIDLSAGSLGGSISTYYIDTAIAAGTSSFSVSGKSYVAADFANMDSSWSPSGSESTFFISGGTAITGLSTNVVRTAPILGGQSQIALEIKQNSTVLFKFECADNIVANINIVGNSSPVFKVVETIGDEVATENTSYVVGGKTKAKIAAGIEAVYVATVAQGNSRSFSLLGDSIQASLYPGYAGTFSTTTELSATNGKVISASGARSVTASYYRGLVKTNDISSSQVLAMSRSAATAIFTVKSGSDSYTQDLSDIYNGKVCTINALSTLGDIGLKLTFSASRFVGGTNSKQSITPTFGKYKVTVSNPLVSTEPTVTTIDANTYIIQAFKGSSNLNIVSGKAVVVATEKYAINYSLSGLAVYKSTSDFVCDARTDIRAPKKGDAPEPPKPGDPPTWTLFETYGDAALRATTTDPVTEVTTLTGVTFNHLRLTRNVVNVSNSFTTYFNCPRPQLKVEAVSRLDVVRLPYTPYVVPAVGETITNNGPAPKEYYVDMDFASVKRPFFINGAVVAGLNDIKLSYVSPERYTTKRLVDADQKTAFAINSNKITVKLFPNFSGVFDSTKTDASNNIVSTVINDEYISSLGAEIIQDDKFSSSYDNTKLLAAFSYSQPLDIITADVKAQFTLTGPTRNVVKNIRVNNIHAFSTSTGSLDMDPGDSVSMDVYGLRLIPGSKQISSNPDSYVSGMNVTFVKYSTDYSIDFYNQEVQSIVKELLITPNYRHTKTAFVAAPAYVYLNSSTIMAKMLQNITLPAAWSNDTDYTPTTLETRLSSLDGRGKELLFKMLTVSPEYPINVLLMSQPDLINFKSASGASKFRVNYNGVLMVNRIQNEQLLLGDESGTDNGNLAQQLFSGRVTKFSAP